MPAGAESSAVPCPSCGQPVEPAGAPAPVAPPPRQRALSPAELARASMQSARPAVSVEQKYLGTTKARQRKREHKQSASALLVVSPLLIVGSIVGALVFQGSLRVERLVALLVVGISLGFGGLFEGLYLRSAGTRRVRKEVVHALCILGGLVIGMPIALLILTLIKHR